MPKRDLVLLLTDVARVGFALRLIAVAVAMEVIVRLDKAVVVVTTATRCQRNVAAMAGTASCLPAAGCGTTERADAGYFLALET